MTPVRILLADDHTLVRAGLRVLVEKLPGVEVVGEAADGREAMKIVAEQAPDVVLMDIAMPGFNGVEATARIVEQSPHTNVVVVSVHADAESVLDAIDAGASGYILKDATVAELELAIQAVMKGGTFLSPRVSQYVIDGYRRRAPGTRGSSRDDMSDAGSARDSCPERTQMARLTRRQREILQLIAEGASSRAMARILNLSVKTIESHRAQLMERLDIHELAGLVRFAIRAGLVRNDSA